MKAKARPWRDVGNCAEVTKVESGLHVQVITRNGEVRSLFIADLSLDPVAAVQRCRKEGQVVEE